MDHLGLVQGRVWQVDQSRYTNYVRAADVMTQRWQSLRLHVIFDFLSSIYCTGDFIYQDHIFHEITATDDYVKHIETFCCCTEFQLRISCRRCRRTICWTAFYSVNYLQLWEVERNYDKKLTSWLLISTSTGEWAPEIMETRLFSIC